MNPIEALKKTLIELLTPDKIITAEYHKGIMTVIYSKSGKKQYNGSCTVWHEMPLMNRCSTAKESELVEIWHYIKQYGNKYPESHLVASDDCNYDKTIY
jgi:hypothetical protein